MKTKQLVIQHVKLDKQNELQQAEASTSSDAAFLHSFTFPPARSGSFEHSETTCKLDVWSAARNLQTEF
jgi:hypothetical protein